MHYDVKIGNMPLSPAPIIPTATTAKINPISLVMTFISVLKLKGLYKALLRIAKTIYENDILINQAEQSLDKAVTILHHTRPEHVNIVSQYKELTEIRFTWLTSVRSQYHLKDFGDVFEKYLITSIKKDTAGSGLVSFLCGIFV